MDWLRRKVWSLPVLIRNPGGLHNTLTEENLYAGCQPVRRNQILAGFLRDYESPATKRQHRAIRPPAGAGQYARRG